MKYGNRSPWKRILTSPLAMIVFLIILIFMARSAWKIHQTAVLSAEKLTQARAEFARLQERQTDLSVKVTRMSTPDGLESEIRAKYRAVKEGESVAVIVDDSPTQVAAVSAATSTPPSSPKLSWWRRLLQKIGW